MKKLFSLILALILCLGVLPMTTMAGEIIWSGGSDPNCDHEGASGGYAYVNETYHKYVISCPKCGATGQASANEKHEWETSEITPGGPDYPEGGTIYYCPICGKEIVKKPGEKIGEETKLKDLSKVKLTDTKDKGAAYSKSDMKKVGLKGLKEGKQYTAEITSKTNEDGTESWVKTFKSIEGKSTGERVFTAKKKVKTETEREVISTVTHVLTVNFVAADAELQNRMPEPVKKNYNPGKTYHVPVPDVPGLSPNIKGEVTGTMPNEDLTVTVTFVRFYQLTIYLIYPNAETEEGEGSWHETYSLPDGTEYNYPISELLEEANLMRDTSSAGDMFSDMARGLNIIALTEALTAFTPDRDPVQGKIEGADKEETVRFTCPHPEESFSYDHESRDSMTSEGHGTHQVSCGLCGAVVREEEPCEFVDTFMRVTAFNEFYQDKFPNGAIKHGCSKCRDYYYENADAEACPGSNSGEPHDWTEWTSVDDDHCSRTCNRCGKEVTQAHTTGEWTSTGDLYHTSTCKSCHATVQRTHKGWFVYKVNKQATRTESADVEAKCGVCGAHITRIPDEILPDHYKAGSSGW